MEEIIVVVVVLVVVATVALFTHIVQQLGMVPEQILCVSSGSQMMVKQLWIGQEHLDNFE